MLVAFTDMIEIRSGKAPSLETSIAYVHCMEGGLDTIPVKDVPLALKLKAIHISFLGTMHER